MLDALTGQLTRRIPLTDEQVHEAVGQLIDETVAVESKAAFLTALANKGETPEEITAFVRELRQLSVQPTIDPSLRNDIIVDVVGTGGDRMKTFNISTAAALVAAAAGVRVAKHGNRAITSQTGSADVLEALGFRIDLSPDEAGGWLRDYGFVFFFAPKYHPAFKHIAPARKRCAERGQRTIFNLLGPLLNPARPNAQLVGVPRPEFCEPIARVLQSLGLLRGMVVCGSVASQGLPAAFMDEICALGENTVAEFYHERGLTVSSLSPDHLPVQAGSVEDLSGGDCATNAEHIRRLFRGEETGPKRDAVLLNAAAVLLIAGRARTLTDGWDLASQILDEGRALAKLELLVQASRRAT